MSLSFEGYHLALPPRFTEFRPHQEHAIADLLEGFKTRSIMFLDAPTGAGKTLIGETVRQILDLQHHFGAALYVCTTRTLQDQVMHDFPYARVIKGRSNYPTADEPSRFELTGARHLDASMCVRRTVPGDQMPLCDACPDFGTSHHEEQEIVRVPHCLHCHPVTDCPYSIAKEAALRGPLAVANTSYFLTEANVVGRFGVSRSKGGGDRYPFGLIVVDEADTIESVLMSYIELNLSPRFMRRYRLDPLVGPRGGPGKPADWIAWIDHQLPVFQVKWQDLNRQVSRYVADMPPSQLLSEEEEWRRAFVRLRTVRDQLAVNPNNWVLDSYREGGVVLKPVEVSAYAHDVLFRHAPRWLLMSATLISAQQMATDLGLADNEWGSVSVRSNFPPSRRPLVVRPVSLMSHKSAETKAECWPPMFAAIESVLVAHPDDRVLVHTVSYDLTQNLAAHLRRTEHADRIMTYESAAEREAVLADYRASHGAVLLSPSFERGVDLADDDCRVIIMAKVPYPNLGDKQVEARVYRTATGQSWMATETIRSMVQMTGRGMRHADDFCITYILDANFSRLWSKSQYRYRIPEWWAEAIRWEAPTL